MAHEFLSDDWLTEVGRIREEHGPENMIGAGAKLNMTVTGGPQGTYEVHIDDGQYGNGLMDDAVTTLTVPYDIARQVFVQGAPMAAMQAFMAGQVQLEGDPGQLMNLQNSLLSPSAEQKKVIELVSEATAT